LKFDNSEPIAREYSEHQRIAPRVPRVVSVSFRLTDMGNGVDRIEHWAQVPFDEAHAGANGLDVEPLSQPSAPRIRDAVEQVLGALGIKAPGGHELLIEGYCKLVTPHSLDVVAWMVVMV
jgi:hypothetical protein